MGTVATPADHTAALEQDLDELSALLWETFRGLKHSSPPPAAMREAIEHGGLGPRHMPALLAVAAAGPLSVSELARRLGLSLSTTSAIAGELSRAGLLERSEDEADHRRTIVRVPDGHADVILEWADLAILPLRATLTRLSPRARQNFLAGWRILHEEATRGAPADGEDCEPPRQTGSR
jgi:DNA-binding MarR family transcriptional regulator